MKNRKFIAYVAVGITTPGHPSVEIVEVQIDQPFKLDQKDLAASAIQRGSYDAFTTALQNLLASLG